MPTNSLNQFYSEIIHRDFVNYFSDFLPKSALDLGFGEGHLLYAAKERWPEIQLIGVDIDPQNVNKAYLEKKIYALHLDGLSFGIVEKLKKQFPSIDLLISNPPYFQIPITHEIQDILKAANIHKCLPKNLKKIPAELVFFAQNLRLLSDNGKMGMVVPAGLISGEKWTLFRRHILDSYYIHNIIQLPCNAFRKTDAQTFIIILSKPSTIKEPPSSIKLSSLELTQSIIINKQALVKRADFNYHFYKKNCPNNPVTELSESNFLIFRGNRTHNQLKIDGRPFLHTTTLPKNPESRKYPLHTSPKKTKINYTKQGDIVLARVGRRCLGKMIMIQKGSIAISDCLIVIRASERKYREYIWKKLTSPQGETFFSNVALGVSAKYITHNLLKEFLLEK